MTRTNDFGLPQTKKGVPDLDDRGRLGWLHPGRARRGDIGGAGAVRERSPSMTDRSRTVWPLRIRSVREDALGGRVTPSREMSTDPTHRSLMRGWVGSFVFSCNRVPKKPIVAPERGKDAWVRTGRELRGDAVGESRFSVSSRAVRHLTIPPTDRQPCPSSFLPNRQDRPTLPVARSRVTAFLIDIKYDRYRDDGRGLGASPRWQISAERDTLATSGLVPQPISLERMRRCAMW